MNTNAKPTDDESKVPVKAYTGKELQTMYNITGDMWLTWRRPLLPALRKLGYRDNQQVYTIAQVELIFERLGRP
jgi:hypothetical protein